MNDTTIATVGDLIAALSDYDPATPVRIATTESAAYMDHTIGRVTRTPADPDAFCALSNDTAIVRIGTGAVFCCLPDSVIDVIDAFGRSS